MQLRKFAHSRLHPLQKWTRCPYNEDKTRKSRRQYRFASRAGTSPVPFRYRNPPRAALSFSPLCRYTAANPAVVFLKQGMAVPEAVAPAVLLWYPQPGRPSTVSRGYARSCCERLNGGKGYAGPARAPAAALSKALRLSRAFHLCQPVYSGTFQTQIRFTC